MKHAATVILFLVVVSLQILVLQQLSDHDERMETRAGYAIQSRNAIRDQLDGLDNTCRR